MNTWTHENERINTWIRNQETNKSAIAKHCWESDHTFHCNFDKSIYKANSVFKLDFLDVSINKKCNNILNCNFAIPLLSDCWICYNKTYFSWFFLLFQALQVSPNFDILLFNTLTPPASPWIRWKFMNKCRN